MSYEKGVNQRKARLRLLHRMISETKDSIAKTTARFCCETGVSLYTARRYLKVLRDAGLVSIEEAEV